MLKVTAPCGWFCFAPKVFDIDLSQERPGEWFPQRGIHNSREKTVGSTSDWSFMSAVYDKAKEKSKRSASDKGKISRDFKNINEGSDLGLFSLENFFILWFSPAILSSELFFDDINECHSWSLSFINVSIVGKCELSEKSHNPRGLLRQYSKSNKPFASVTSSRSRTWNRQKGAEWASLAYLARKRCGLRLEEIGQEFGIEKYSSASSIVTRTEKQLVQNKQLRKRIDEISLKLNKS